MTILLEPIPIPIQNKMSVRSEEKIMCQTSVRVHFIILITWILADAKKSRNSQTRENLVEKLEFSIGGKIKIIRKWNVYE